MEKEYWITNSRFKLIVIVMIVIWISIFILFFLKADEITKHPCEVCAKSIGEDVVCRAGTHKIAKLTFFANFSRRLLEMPD